MTIDVEKLIQAAELVTDRARLVYSEWPPKEVLVPLSLMADLRAILHPDIYGVKE